MPRQTDYPYVQAQMFTTELGADSQVLGDFKQFGFQLHLGPMETDGGRIGVTHPMQNETLDAGIARFGYEPAANVEFFGNQRRRDMVDGRIARQHTP